MPRGRRPHLKQRKDGRYCKVYKGQQIMGRSEDEVYDMYDQIIEDEKAGLKKPITVGEFASAWLPIAYPNASYSYYRGLATHLQKLVNVIGSESIRDVLPSMIKRVYAEKYAGLSNSYVLDGRLLFCALFDAAVADGYC